jgi:hypothetical protein
VVKLLRASLTYIFNPNIAVLIKPKYDAKGLTVFLITPAYTTEEFNVHYEI